MKVFIMALAILGSTSVIASPPSKKVAAKIEGEVLRNFYHTTKGQFIKISNLWITENEETGGYFGHISFTDIEFQDVPDCFSTAKTFDNSGKPTGGFASSSKCSKP